MNSKSPRIAFLRETRVGRILFDLTLVLIALILLELCAYGSAVLYFKFKGRSIELANTQFLVGRLFQENPVEKNTHARYLGHMGSMFSLREWHVADPVLGWRLGKDVGITLHHGSAEGVEWNITNPQGFAPSDSLSFHVDLKKPSGIFRIIFLGGSTVEGMGAKTPLDNLPSQFAQLVKKTARPKGNFTGFEVVNAGVAGYSTPNEYLYFITELINYDPDLVIFYDGINDLVLWFEMSLGKYPDLVRSNSGQKVFPKRLPHHNKWAKRLNESYTFFGSLGHVFGNIEKVFDENTYQLALAWIIVRTLEKSFTRDPPKILDLEAYGGFVNINDSEIYEKVTSLFKSNIQDSIDFSLSRNVQFAAFLQPVVGVDDKKYFPEAAKRIENNLKEIRLIKNTYGYFREMFDTVSNSYKDKTNVCIADLSRYLEKEKDRMYSDTYAHLNRQGNALMARGIRDKLINCGILELLPLKN